MPMSAIAKKFIAVILAIWLPLFSGSALAAAVTMQSMAGDHHSAVMQPGEPQLHCTLTMQQNKHHAMHDAGMDQFDGPQNQQDAAGDNCGTCHFACCGYMAAAAVNVSEAPPPARLFPSLATQFTSITLTPLGHPPLSRI